MLLVYNYVLLKMSTWYSKHVVESNNILRINNSQCIKLVIIVWSLTLKLSLCTPWRHEGSGGMLPFILNVHTRWSWVVAGRFYPSIQDCGASEPVRPFIATSLTLSEIEPRFLGHPTRSICVVSTALSRPTPILGIFTKGLNYFTLSDNWFRCWYTRTM